MPTHWMTLDSGETRPYAYCPNCGWAETYTTDAEAQNADKSHAHNDLGDTRYDDTGHTVEPTPEA